MAWRDRTLHHAELGCSRWGQISGRHSGGQPRYCIPPGGSGASAGRFPHSRPPLGEADASQKMKTSELTEAEAENSRPYAKAPATAAGRRAYRNFTCEHCGRDFWAKPVHDRRGVSPRRFCSKPCAAADRTAAMKCANAELGGGRRVRSRSPSARQHPAELIEMSRMRTLTPAQSAKLQSYILGLLRMQIPLAHRVVMGEVTWSATQARVFGQLLNKCIPDLSAAFGMNENLTGKELSVLSGDELETLASVMDAPVASPKRSVRPDARKKPM